MKLLVIEDQTMIRQLLVMACKLTVPAAEVFSAADGASGVELCRKEQPDLVTLDLVLPDRDGLNLVPALRAAVPAVKILVLSSHVDEFTFYRLQQSGVNGFVDKNAQTLEVLREAIDAILAGDSYNCSIIKELAHRMRADPLAFPKLLSRREIEVLGLLGRGWSNERVAERLNLSPRTARNHRQNIMKKLGLSSTTQLIRYALEKGFARVGM